MSTRSRRTKRPTGASATPLLSLLLLALGVLVALLASVERPARRSILAGAPLTCSVATALPELALGLEPLAAEHEIVAQSPTPEHAQGVLERSTTARDALGELALILEDAEATRPLWETAVHATAGSLGASCVDGVIALASDASSSASERVAAADVLRILASTEDPAAASCELSTVARKDLRTAAAERDPFPLRWAVANRLLVWFGDARDQLLLLQALLDPQNEEHGEMAAFVLQVSRSPAVVLELADAAARREDPRVQERALVALEWILREPRGLFPSPALRSQVASTIRQALAHPACRAQTRLRGIALLGTLGGDEAREALGNVLGDPRVSDQEFRAAAGAMAACGVTALHDLADFLADEVPEGHRLGAAEAIVRAAPAAPGARLAEARMLLRSVAKSAETSTERRRAVTVLASHRDPDDLQWLGQLTSSLDDLTVAITDVGR